MSCIFHFDIEQENPFANVQEGNKMLRRSVSFGAGAYEMIT